MNKLGIWVLLLALVMAVLIFIIAVIIYYIICPVPVYPPCVDTGGCCK